MPRQFPLAVTSIAHRTSSQLAVDLYFPSNSQVNSRMATLDTPAQMPPGLQLEQPPSVNNLIAQIDDWVIYHLLRTLESDIHYENQLYGPISSFLTSIFPSRR